MDRQAVGTRAIGRNAIREELARVALPQFIGNGFDKVTFDALAAAAGVSRSTFLRYFASKEDVVLFVFDAIGDAIVDALGSGPEEVSEWDALRHCLDPALAFLGGPGDTSDHGNSGDSGERLALMRLIWETPALYSRLHEKQASWRPRMVRQLSKRDGSPPASPLTLRTRVAAALECLTVALESWLGEDGRSKLGDLLDQTFEAISSIR